MNVLLKFRERIATLSHSLLLEFEQLLTVIRQTFRAEHNDDGTHTDVTAMSVTTESVAAETLVAAQNVTAGASASAGPSGWHTIGRTETVFFDPAAAEPVLLRPGDRIRFVAERLLP